MSEHVRCVEEDCPNEATVSMTLTPHFEAVPAIRLWYIDILRARHPSVEIDFHQDCHLRAQIEACSLHVEPLASIWTGFLYGEYDPVLYDQSASDDDLALFGWTVEEGGRLEQWATRPGPPTPPSSPSSSSPTPAPIAGGSGERRSHPTGLRNRRKRQRQARKQARR